MLCPAPPPATKHELEVLDAALPTMLEAGMQSYVVTLLLVKGSRHAWQAGHSKPHRRKFVRNR